MIQLAPLVAVCNQSEQIFADAIQSSASSDFRAFAGRIRQLLNEYGFQLRIELQRISAGSPGTLDVDSRLLSRNSNCQSALRSLLENYRAVLSGQIPPHTRAMIRRQYEQLQRVCNELSELVRALSGLLSGYSAA